MRYSLVLVFCGLLLKAAAQVPNTSDCAGAIIICDTSYIQISGQPETNNIPDEVNPSTTCLILGEVPGRWYRFEVLDQGTLSFSIIPEDTTADYDWVLYDMTGSDCAHVRSDPSLMKACNFSGINNNHGITGANGGIHPTDEPVVQADSAHQYYLYVASYAGDYSGYEISFAGSTIGFQDCAVVSTEEQMVSSLLLYPNPSADIVQVSGLQGAETISVYSVVGRLLRSSVVTGAQHTERIAGLENGIYFMVVEFPGKKETLTFIKQ